MQLTALPNVSMPCVTTRPCTCPTYGVGGEWVAYNHGGPDWYCKLILQSPGGPVAEPVPTLSEWAVIVIIGALAIVGARGAR